MILHGAIAIDSIDPDGRDDFWIIRRSVSISFFMTQLRNIMRLLFWELSDAESDFLFAWCKTSNGWFNFELFHPMATIKIARVLSHVSNVIQRRQICTKNSFMLLENKHNKINKFFSL
jgi:hypothetical protein